MTIALAVAALLVQGAPVPAPQAEFMARIQALCGKAFAGRLVSRDAADSAMLSASTSKSWRVARPAPVVAPPYWVSLSALPSAWR